MHALDRFLARVFGYPLLTVQVVLYVFIAWGLMGSGLGLSDLYWHEHWWTQLLVGASSCWLFGTVVFVNILLVGPRDLPGTPTDPLSSFWTTRGPDCKPQRLPTLFPSRNPGVRRVGTDMLAWLALFFLLVYTGRWVAVGLGDAEPPLLGLPFVAGYFGSVLVGALISAVANSLHARERLADWDWLRQSFDRPSVRIPTVDFPGLHGENSSALPATLVPFVGDEFVFPAGAPQPIHVQIAAYNMRALRLLHALAFIFGALNSLFLMVVVVLIACGYQLPPAVVLSLYLIFLNVTGGFFAFRTRTARAAGLALVVVLFALNSSRFERYRMTFDGIACAPNEPSYDRPLALNESFFKGYGGREPADKLIGASELLSAHATTENGLRKAPDGDAPRLVLVAVSGGGIRAAVWTAVVLEGLEQRFPRRKDARGNERPGVRDLIRVIAGASGGMVGAAAYAGAFPNGPLMTQPDDHDGSGLAPLSAALATDSLSPVIQTMLVRDFTFNTFVPLRSKEDRGRTLQEQWDKNFAHWTGGSPFARTFTESRAGERTALRPALVFTPMMVEDSKRLFVSNLNLAALAGPEAHRTREPGRTRPDLLSRTGLEFFRLFPRADGFTLGTAARMSATFPVVSPAVPLPTNPVRRVVDAGYFDNYGIDALTHWLLYNKADVVARTSGVLLIQVRAYPLETAGSTMEDDTPSPAMRLVGAVSAPLEAVFTARGSAAYHRNNELLAELHRAYNTPGAHPRARGDYFTTVTFECQRPAALSWYLTPADKREVARGFFNIDDRGRRAAPLETIIETMNQMEAWLNAPTLQKGP